MADELPILGAHMSIAGGYYKAVERAAARGMATCQIFTKNSNQWRAKEILPDEARRFQETLATHGIAHPLAHDSYLINLAAPDEALWRKSVEAFVIELRRAAQLGIAFVVTHPGSYTTGSEEAGLRRVIEGLDSALAQTSDLPVGCLLENTAGQGTSLGWRFEHLATILEGVRWPERLGVCIDTCHLFAAGYPLGTEKEYQATMRKLDRVVGLGQVKAFHLNDSKRELGSRVDRHAKIGGGCLGREPFGYLLRDARFRGIPMYLETPKGEENGVDLDEINLATLRELAASRRRGRSASPRRQ